MARAGWPIWTAILALLVVTIIFSACARPAPRMTMTTDTPEAPRYEAVSSCVDLVVYGNHRRLEYDVVVAADAHPGAMPLKIDGVDVPELDATGDRLLRGCARPTVQ